VSYINKQGHAPADAHECWVGWRFDFPECLGPLVVFPPGKYF